MEDFDMEEETFDGKKPKFNTGDFCSDRNGRNIIIIGVVGDQYKYIDSHGCIGYAFTENIDNEFNVTRTMDEIARNAASTWCRCFKCDGIINGDSRECDKPHLLTCGQWYDSFRASKLAISEFLSLLEENIKANNQ